MKNNSSIIAIGAILLLVSGCVINLQDTITGDGNTVTQTRDLQEFSGIKVGSGIDVFVTQGETQKVEVEADENLQEWIRTEVEGSVLHIYVEKSIRMAKSKKVSISCKAIDRLDISSAAEVTGLSRFKTDKLDIDLSSAGKLKFEVEAGEIRLSASSAAKGYLKGTAQKITADLSSAGEMAAFDLETKVCDISVSSAGKARTWVTDEASFQASSGGNINYTGEPKIRNINTSSGGSVNKKD